MPNTRAVRAAVTVIAALLLAGGCGGSSDKTVKATAGEYTLRLDTSTLSSGKVKIETKNIGGVAHEFVVVRADSASSLPTKSDGSADEDKIAEGDKRGEVEDIAPGSSKAKTFDLSPGKYVAFCNIVDDGVSHYAKGMHVEFTVSR